MNKRFVWLHFECGKCRKGWEQPYTDPCVPGWNVCPYCNFAAPTNLIVADPVPE